MRTILDFARARQEGRSIILVAAYDAQMARLIAASPVDAILVGDSVAMVVHGHPSTVQATLEMMQLHTAAVRRGAPDRMVVADMPFGTVRRGRKVAAAAAEALVRAGANAVKIEGLTGHEDVVEHLVGGGIPVMGHLGLTPQSVNLLGGYRVQAREEQAARKLEADAHRLEALGAFAVVLECVPQDLARAVTAGLAVPTIGIGAGPGTSGQVLVLNDLLGLDPSFRPRFARRYVEGHDVVSGALKTFVSDVQAGRFPATEEILA